MGEGEEGTGVGAEELVVKDNLGGGEEEDQGWLETGGGGGGGKRAKEGDVKTLGESGEQEEDEEEEEEIPDLEDEEDDEQAIIHEKKGDDGETRYQPHTSPFLHPVNFNINPLPTLLSLLFFSCQVPKDGIMPC